MNCRKTSPEPRVYNITEFSDYIEANPPSKIICNLNDQPGSYIGTSVSGYTVYQQIKIPEHSKEIRLSGSGGLRVYSEVNRVRVWPEYSALGTKVEVFYVEKDLRRKNVVRKIVLTVD